MFGRRYLVDSRVAYRAVNYLCQGSAADLLKKAMLRIQRMLMQRSTKSALLMQIHDEVVLEVHESEDTWIPRLVSDLMVQVPECRLPLKASVERADGNWENLHKVCMACGDSFVEIETPDKQKITVHESTKEKTCPLNARWPKLMSC